MLKSYLEKQKRLKIGNPKLEITEMNDDEIYEQYRPLTYKEKLNYVFRLPYRRRYHFNEIFNRIYCCENNKPDVNELLMLSKKLNGDFSKDSIYLNSTYNQRKHLIYIWICLNNDTQPKVTPEIIDRRSDIWHHLNLFYFNLGHNKKSFKYRLVMDVVCELRGWEDTRRLLYFKDDPKKREFVKETILGEAQNQSCGESC